jgi:glucose/arabinose dehydrogenase
VFGDQVPVTSIAFYQRKIYVVHGGTVSIIQSDGTLKDIITDLPGQGDHQADSLVFKDGKMYLSIGTVTNSAVVGPDNAVFGWLKKPELQSLHDVPCEEITLTENATFASKNVTGTDLPEGKTSAYAAYGTDLGAGTTIPGSTKCNGAILEANPDGTDLMVYAWGFRNPYGLEIGPDGALYASMHGFDARGSRPIENAWDCFYKVQQGAWYGWPDFACDVAVTNPRFKPKDQPQPQFIIANHPTENPPTPITKFPPHAATNGFTFAKSGFGKSTDVFLALFGDFTPATGTVTTPQGVKIVRIDTTNGKITDFITNKIPGMASTHSAGGLEHPSSVTFGPDGAMYITDWDVARVSVNGLKLQPNSGVIWKVTKVSGATAGMTGGPSFLLSILGTIILAIITFFLLKGDEKLVNVGEGAKAGGIAALIMGIFTMIISVVPLQLPWYAPPRVLATLVMGRNAMANILQFDLLSFVIGLIVVVVLGIILGILFSLLLRTINPMRIILGALFYSLIVWVFLQYFLFPLIDPLITEKGFPPFWYAISFAVFGLSLGIAIHRFYIERR